MEDAEWVKTGGCVCECVCMWMLVKPKSMALISFWDKFDTGATICKKGQILLYFLFALLGHDKTDKRDGWFVVQIDANSLKQLTLVEASSIKAGFSICWSCLTSSDNHSHKKVEKRYTCGSSIAHARSARRLMTTMSRGLSVQTALFISGAISLKMLRHFELDNLVPCVCVSL